MAHRACRRCRGAVASVRVRQLVSITWPRKQSNCLSFRPEGLGELGVLCLPQGLILEDLGNSPFALTNYMYRRSPQALENLSDALSLITSWNEIEKEPN
jgi:hypothetical protein